MATRTIGIVIDGATGRLGTTQHLRALLAMRGEGGLPLGNGDRLMPEPVLLGAMPRDSPRWPRRAAGSDGALIATRAWQIRRSTSISMPPRRAAVPTAPARPLPPASMSTSRSR